MVFPVVMCGCESWTIKKAEHRRIDAFELWCWRRLLREIGRAHVWTPVTKSCPALQSHGLQLTRLPCSSLSHGVCSNLCPLSQWCCPTISSSVVPFFSSLQSFQMSQLFASGGQSIGVSTSTSVLPMNIQDWFPLGLTGWSPCTPRDPQESSPTPQFKSINSSVLSFLYGPTFTSTHDHWKNHTLD